MTLRDDDLDNSVKRAERDEIAHVASRLETERPVPSAGFRGQLRRTLATAERSGLLRGAARRRVAYGSLVTGAALLAVAAAGLASVGPLSPSDAADAVASVIRAL
jgi:hypothetical protein